jgi:hypothetical protein
MIGASEGEAARISSFSVAVCSPASRIIAMILIVPTYEMAEVGEPNEVRLPYSCQGWHGAPLGEDA